MVTLEATQCLEIYYISTYFNGDLLIYPSLVRYFKGTPFHYANPLYKDLHALPDPILIISDKCPLYFSLNLNNSARQTVKQQSPDAELANPDLVGNEFLEIILIFPFLRFSHRQTFHRK